MYAWDTKFALNNQWLVATWRQNEMDKVEQSVHIWLTLSKVLGLCSCWSRMAHHYKMWVPRGKLFSWFVSQPTSNDFLSHQISISSQPAVFFTNNKSAPATRHSQPYRTNETKGEMSASKRKGRVQKEKKEEEASTMNSSRSKIPSNICIEDNYSDAYIFLSKD